jgi:hypothetical protein
MKRRFSFLNNHWLITALVVIGFFIMYSSVTPDHLVNKNNGGDDGDYISAILTGGIPHPTGYPTFTMLGQIFLLIPLGTPYFRVALMSGISAALAAGLFFLWMVKVILKDEKYAILGALCAAIGWGTAPLVWGQAFIVDVFALQALFVMAVIWWVTLIIRQPQTTREKVLLSFLSVAVGLSLGNHITIVLMAPACLAALWLARKRGMPVRFLVVHILFMAAGGLVYLYFPLSARNYPPVNWGNPQNWKGFIWLITGNPYQSLLFKTPFLQLVQRFGALARLLLEQASIPGLFVGIAGAVLASLPKPPLRWLLWWVCAAYAIFALGYNTIDSTDYLIPAWFAFCAWIGTGAAWLANLQWRTRPVGFWGALILAVFFAARAPFILPSIDARQDMQATHFAENYLAIAPPNAILLANDDGDIFPLWYYHFGLKKRPDLRVIAVPLTQFSWYQETLSHNYPDLRLPPIQDNAENWDQEILRLNPSRPVCRSQVIPDKANDISVECPAK